MTERPWDRFLTDQDRAHVKRQPAAPTGRGERPALLLVDLYRWVFGDKPEPLLDAIERWPGSCGMAAWEAIPHIQRVLSHAREATIPVIHVTGLDAIPGWRSGTPRGGTQPEAVDQRRRRYDIINEVAPRDGEPVLRKSAPSAFWGTPLAGYLNSLGIDTIVVAGESTSGCVRATVVDAKSYRYNVVVVADCVFDRHQASHAINLFDMDQKYADVVSVDEAITYIRNCRTTHPTEPSAA